MNDSVLEIELKFQVPTARRAAVRAFVAGRAPGSSQSLRLQAAYFDTPGRTLAQASMALRLRREGRRWVQTLKASGTDGLSRDEHNVVLSGNPADARSLQADPLRHAEVAVGQRLSTLLQTQPPGALVCTYRSDIRRLTRRLRSRFGTVELAFDEGHLEADGRQLAVCELEIELLSGHPMAVLDVARRWALRFGLWLDTRSKAERGDMLARQVVIAPPRRAGPVRLHREQSASEALQAVVAECRQQVLVNAAQVASGDCEAEHLHQLRVGLRRLRSGLSLLAGDAAAAAQAEPLATSAAALLRRLGASRDGAVIEGKLGAALVAALRGLGIDGSLPVVAPACASPDAVLREAVCQGFLLDLIAVGLAPPPRPPLSSPSSPRPLPTAPPHLRAQIARCLARWQRTVRRDAAAFDSLDEAARHRLRKRIKRLRYAAEFATGLFDADKGRRSLKALRSVQDKLGALNDVAVGLQAFESVKAEDPRAWFALGWLAARREALLAEAAPALKTLAKRKRGWKP